MEEAEQYVGEELFAQLNDEIELLDGASAEFDQEQVDKGLLSPVFFGSALTNFGVEIFLKHFLKMTSSPLPRKADKPSSTKQKQTFSYSYTLIIYSSFYFRYKNKKDYPLFR